MFDATNKSNPAAWAPSQTALVLLDYHEMFVRKLPSGPFTTAINTAAEMRTWAKTHGMPIIHAIVDIDLSPFPTCKNSSMLSGVVTTMREQGTGHEAPEIWTGGKEGDFVFKRVPGHVSFLKAPGQVEFLRERGIKSLVILGLSTSGCVLRGCCTAADEEFVVTVISDGCADPQEGVHDLLVEKVLPNRAFVATGAEFREGYDAARGGKWESSSKEIET